MRPGRSIACGVALLVAACTSCTSTQTSSPVARPPDQIQPGDGTVDPLDAPAPASSAAPTSSPATSVGSAPATAPVDATRLRTSTPIPIIPRLTGWAAFDQSMLMILDRGSIAVSATVLRDGVVEHEVALGSRTMAGDDPVQVGDRFRVASISKVITSITMLRLVDAGVVGLDDPIGGRLAARLEVPSTASIEVITIRNLLTHRSGIGQYEDLVFRNQVGSCPEAAAVALSAPLAAQPATTFRYSNVNYCLAGLAIEELTGRPYPDVVDEQLLAPLGIEGMRLANTFDEGADLPVEHRSDADRNYMEVLGAAGAWIASPTEIVTILNSLDPDTPGWKPLTSATLDEMRTITVDPPPPPPPPDTSPDTSLDTAAPVPEPPPPPPPPETGYGMGLMIFAPGTFGHTGTVESTHAMTVRRPDGLTWAVTVSGDYPGSTRQLASIVDRALRYAGITGR